jgi:hypothetical protein
LDERESLCKYLYGIYHSGSAVNEKRHYSDCKICGANSNAIFIDPFDSSEKRLTACDLLVKKSETSNFIIPSIILHIIQKHNLKPTLRASVKKVKTRLPFHIDAWVVLPDHMHCIWTLPLGDQGP